MEPEPQKDNAGLQRPEIASNLRKSAPEKRALADSRNRGKAYIPKPEFAEEEKKPTPKGGVEALDDRFGRCRTPGIRCARDSRSGCNSTIKVISF